MFFGCNLLSCLNKNIWSPKKNLNNFSAEVFSAAILAPLCGCTALLVLHHREKLFYPPSAQRACNHHSVCSCWTKWTEDYLKAYHWHCITQNSFCLCNVHLSLVPDPHLAWLGGHFARGELEEIVCSPSVCSPFKSLDLSVEQRNS